MSSRATDALHKSEKSENQAVTNHPMVADWSFLMNQLTKLVQGCTICRNQDMP
jgi:uridine kinase